MKVKWTVRVLMVEMLDAAPQLKCHFDGWLVHHAC